MTGESIYLIVARKQRELEGARERGEKSKEAKDKNIPFQVMPKGLLPPTRTHFLPVHSVMNVPMDNSINEVSAPMI